LFMHLLGIAVLFFFGTSNNSLSFCFFFFFFPKFFSCTRILLSMHVLLSLLLFCVSSEDQDDLHYSSRFISTPSKKVGFR
jgi:uncharacterized membrane protein